MGSNQSTLCIFTIIIISLWFYISNSNLSDKNLELWSEISTLETDVEDLETSVSDYEEALQQANDNIEEAKDSAWGTYQDMGDALDTLETVEI